MSEEWTLDQALGWVIWRDLRVVKKLKNICFGGLAMYPPHEKGCGARDFGGKPIKIVNEKDKRPASERLIEALINDRLAASGHQDNKGDIRRIASKEWRRLFIKIFPRKICEAHPDNGIGSFFTGIVLLSEDVKHCFREGGNESIKKAPKSKGQGAINDKDVLKKVIALKESKEVASIRAGVELLQHEISGASLEAKVRRITRKIKQHKNNI